MEDSERNITEIHNNHFFEEFTFSKNKFIGHSKGQQLEFADNVIWIDEFFLIFQIKGRDKTKTTNYQNWFKSKILRKAVQQIKSTLTYLDEYDEILIENERGILHDIAKAKNQKSLKLIVYDPGSQFDNKLRNQKFYVSKEIGLIHLLHLEDYQQICQNLITPYEISEYLNFREQLYKKNLDGINLLSEQYVLKHYFIDHTNPLINISYLQKNIEVTFNLNDFDISFIIRDFNKRVHLTSGKNDYYFIIKEMAKLNRSDLKFFKERFLLAIQKSKNQEFDLPYRMVSSKSGCGFVFIPIEFERKDLARNALMKLTDLHMYDQQLDTGIGMLTYYNEKEKYHDILWMYKHQEWIKDDEFEKIAYKNAPLREMKSKMDYRYYINEK